MSYMQVVLEKGGSFFDNAKASVRSGFGRELSGVTENPDAPLLQESGVSMASEMVALSWGLQPRGSCELRRGPTHCADSGEELLRCRGVLAPRPLHAPTARSFRHGPSLYFTDLYPPLYCLVASSSLPCCDCTTHMQPLMPFWPAAGVLVLRA